MASATNVVDVFSRQWVSFVLSDRATRHEAIMGINNAVADAKPPIPGLTLRVDNGSQYINRDFRASMASLGILLEYIYVNTPEQKRAHRVVPQDPQEGVRVAARVREPRGRAGGHAHGL